MSLTTEEWAAFEALLRKDRKLLADLVDAARARHGKSRGQRLKHRARFGGFATVPFMRKFHPRTYVRLLAAGFVHATDVTIAGGAVIDRSRSLPAPPPEG